MIVKLVSTSQLFFTSITRVVSQRIFGYLSRVSAIMYSSSITGAPISFATNHRANIDDMSLRRRVSIENLFFPRLINGFSIVVFSPALSKNFCAKRFSITSRSRQLRRVNILKLFDIWEPLLSISGVFKEIMIDSLSILFLHRHQETRRIKKQRDR